MKYAAKWKMILCMIGLFFMSIAGSGCKSITRQVLSEGSVITSTDEEDHGTENLVVEGTTEAKSSDKKTEAELSEETVADKIYVHVCGCVKEPGLYEFSAGIRAGDAIEAAGGFTKKADQNAVNLAEVLEDGIQLYIPSEDEERQDTAFSEETEENISSETSESEMAGKVNINTATAEELVGLSGIGEARAEAILSYREENGSFSSIEDIKNVTGIGDGIFEKIKDMITV